MDRGAWRATVHGVAELDMSYLQNNELSPKQPMASMNTPWAVYRGTALEPDILELPLSRWVILDTFLNLLGLSFLSCKWG